jgi:membrane fusion protein (multidrug efflux system)
MTNQLKIQPLSALVALSISITTLLAACGEAPQAAPKAEPLTVDFLTVQPQAATIVEKYPGAIEGVVNVDVKAQVSGYLEAIYVKEGDYVQKGQNLFRIKGDIYNEQVNTSQAAYQAALAAEEHARIELEKIKPLVEGKVVSDVQLSTAEANYAAAKAQAAQARAALGTTSINRDFSLIKAPVSGYIGRIPNRIGNLVTPADAKPLTTLSDIQKVFVYFSLSEADFIAFSKASAKDKGMNSVELQIADGSIYGQKGQLEIASGNIDRSTGSISMKAIFPNPEKLLRSGGSGKIILTRTLDSALTIPMGSVKDIQDRYFVYALGDSNKVTMRPIQVGGTSGNKYIVASGLQPGEKIALNRIDALNDGLVVNPGSPNPTNR